MVARPWLKKLMNPLRKAENYQLTHVLTSQPTEMIYWDSDGRKIKKVAELQVIYMHFTFVAFFQSLSLLNFSRRQMDAICTDVLIVTGP